MTAWEAAIAASALLYEYVAALHEFTLSRSNGVCDDDDDDDARRGEGGREGGREGRRPSKAAMFVALD